MSSEFYSTIEPEQYVNTEQETQPKTSKFEGNIYDQISNNLPVPAGEVVLLKPEDSQSSGDYNSLLHFPQPRINPPVTNTSNSSTADSLQDNSDDVRLRKKTIGFLCVMGTCVLISVMLLAVLLATCFVFLSLLRNDIRSMRESHSDLVANVTQFQNAVLDQLNSSQPSPASCLQCNNTLLSNNRSVLPTNLQQVPTSFKPVFQLNASDENAICPGSLLLHKIHTSNCCILPSPDPSCSTVTIHTGKQYSIIFGTVRGYSRDSVNGFNQRIGNNIDTFYLDGVSLTFFNRSGQRQHIWSFAAERDCSLCSASLLLPQIYVGEHFFCDRVGAGDSVLWDGDQCGLTLSPWFFRKLSQATSSDLEMRLCRNQKRENEDVGVAYAELYIM